MRQAEIGETPMEMVETKLAVSLMVTALVIGLLWAAEADAPQNPGVRMFTGTPMERPLDLPGQLHSFCSRGHHITVLGDHVAVVRGGCR